MYVLTHGNVTVYEWKHDEPPPNQNQNETENTQGNETEELEIDWGDLGSSGDNQQALPSTAEIDFGKSEIDFGTSEIDFGESEIDFGVDIDLSAITIEDSGEVDEAIATTEVKAQASGII